MPALWGYTPHPGLQGGALHVCPVMRTKTCLVRNLMMILKNIHDYWPCTWCLLLYICIRKYVSELAYPHFFIVSRHFHPLTGMLILKECPLYFLLFFSFFSITKEREREKRERESIEGGKSGGRPVWLLKWKKKNIIFKIFYIVLTS